MAQICTEFGIKNEEVLIFLHGGGLSLGGQILLEILSQRKDICKFAIIESALAIPMPVPHSLIKPSIKLSYGLIRQKWKAIRRIVQNRACPCAGQKRW